MEELSLIKSIPVNFGKPMVFSPPSMRSLHDRLVAESKSAEEDPWEAYTQDMTVWEASITPEEKAQYKKLLEAYETAKEAYNPEIHRQNSPEMIRFQEANDAKENFENHTGQHLCCRCFFCYKDDSSPTHECKRCKPPVQIRPYSLACSHFTAEMPEDIEEEMNRAEEGIMRNPVLRRKYEEHCRINEANAFIKEMRTNPSVAFYIYRSDPTHYDNLYQEFPAVFATSPYPTHEDFLADYHEWENDVIVQKNGDTITLSVLEKKFLPPSETTTPTPSANTGSN